MLLYHEHPPFLLNTSSYIQCGAWGRRCNEDECLRLAARYTWLRRRRLLQASHDRTEEWRPPGTNSSATHVHCVHRSFFTSQNLCRHPHCLQPHLCLWSHWTFNAASRLNSRTPHDADLTSKDGAVVWMNRNSLCLAVSGTSTDSDCFQKKCFNCLIDYN